MLVEALFLYASYCCYSKDMCMQCCHLTSLDGVNVIILTLYYSSAVYGECHYTLWIFVHAN
jgi:hypothetical protein